MTFCPGLTLPTATSGPWSENTAYTYFEIDASDIPGGDKRRHGYSRDKRSDCSQVVIALVVIPEGLPLAYEVLPGNTTDNKTLRSFLRKIESQYVKARRIWVMDRGIPTEEGLAEMCRGRSAGALLGGHAERAADPPGKALARQAVAGSAGRRPGQVAGREDDELYVFAQSADRVAKERAMRQRQLKRLRARLHQLAGRSNPATSY